jgi:uncharacterized protein YaaQ
MTRLDIHSLMTAVVQEQDLDVVLRALSALDVPVIHFASMGGFLGRHNATLMIGLPQGAVEGVIAVFQKSCRQRVEYLAIPLEGSPLPLPTPVPITVGGATIFTVEVERYEEF